jgi:selenocysteine-specific elongation factor
MNLSGVGKTDLSRGDIVTVPGWLQGTVLADVQMRHLADAPRPLKHNTQVKLFSGAAETLARVRLLGQDELAPGETGWAQLRLTDPVALTRGDRFILRLPSPAATIGGGIILDPNPGRRYRRYRPEVIERLEALAQGDPGDLMVQALSRQGPTPSRDVLSSAGIGEDPGRVLGQLLDDELVIALGSEPISEPSSSRQLVVTRAWWSDLIERSDRILSGYHRQYPLRAGMGREALRSGLRLDPKVFNAALARLVADGHIVDQAASVRLPSHAVRFTPEQQRAVDGLLAAFRSRPYSTPSVKESVAALGEDVLGVLVERGDLVQVSPEVLFLAETYERMVARVKAHIESAGAITLAGTRDLFGTSRKYAQGLLEHLDETGVTKRVGDARVLR